MINEIGLKIIELRKQKVSIKKIQKILGCSKATISKYCGMLANNDQITNELKLARIKSDHDNEIAEFSRRLGFSENIGVIRQRHTRIARRMWLAVYGGKRCQNCGYDKCLSALSYHHKDPTQKKFEISDYKRRRLELIIEEAQKCVLLCHNCHSEVHEGLLDVSDLPIVKIMEKPPRDIFHWYLKWKLENLGPDGIEPITKPL